MMDCKFQPLFFMTTLRLLDKILDQIEIQQRLTT